MSDADDLRSRWAAWAEFHRRLFGLLTDAEQHMVAEWAGLFAAAGWEPEQLRAASEWLALHDPPCYRSEHLKALQTWLADQLRKLVAQPPGQEDTGWQCVRCRGSGFVEVPNPKPDPLRPERFTLAVCACDCRQGRKVAEQWAKANKSIQALRDYARAYPDWEERLQAHREQERRQQRAVSRARTVDTDLGEMPPRRRAAVEAK